MQTKLHLVVNRMEIRGRMEMRGRKYSLLLLLLLLLLLYMRFTELSIEMEIRRKDGDKRGRKYSLLLLLLLLLFIVLTRAFLPDVVENDDK